MNLEIYHVQYLWIIQLFFHFISGTDYYAYYDYEEEGPEYNISMPRFVDINNNFTFYRGQLATLTCQVEDLGTKTLMWRKTSAPNPLTIGVTRYVKDIRFSAHEVRSKNQWNLSIRKVKPSDAGVYECQVSSKLKSLRWMVRLNVIDGPSPHRTDRNPEIRITGATYIEKGNPLVLVCNATGGDVPPDHIDWFKDGNKIQTNRDRGVSILKDFSLTSGRIASTLTIQYALMPDAGTYVCRTSALQITSAKVHVLNAGTSNVKRGSDDLGFQNMVLESKGTMKSKGTSGNGNAAKSLTLNHSFSLLLVIISLLYNVVR